MPGSATSHYNDALGLNELGHYIQNASQKHLALVHGNSAPEGIANGHGLLMNFLQHKMCVIALVDVVDREIDLLDVRCLTVVVQVLQVELIAPNHRHLFVL